MHTIRAQFSETEALLSASLKSGRIGEGHENRLPGER